MTTERIKTGAGVNRYWALPEVNNAVITNLRREDLLPAICTAAIFLIAPFYHHLALTFLPLSESIFLWFEKP